MIDLRSLPEQQPNVQNSYACITDVATKQKAHRNGRALLLLLKAYWQSTRGTRSH